MVLSISEHHEILNG